MPLLVKVFDYQDMSEEIKDKFIHSLEKFGAPQYNESYHEWSLQEFLGAPEEYDWAEVEPTNNWLLANGAKNTDKSILIHLWW